jgi:hypothetical protein
MYLAAGCQSCLHEILHDFVLRVNGNSTTGQFLKIDAMPTSGEAQFDAMMNQPFPPHAFTNSDGIQQVDSALLKDAGADALFDVGAALRFDNDAFNAFEV